MLWVCRVSKPNAVGLVGAVIMSPADNTLPVVLSLMKAYLKIRLTSPISLSWPGKVKNGSRIPNDASPFRNVFSNPSVSRYTLCLDAAGIHIVEVIVVEVHALGRARALVFRDLEGAAIDIDGRVD